MTDLSHNEDYQIALERIEKVKKLNLQELDLRDLKISSIPEEIREISELTVLKIGSTLAWDLSVNSFSSTPYLTNWAKGYFLLPPFEEEKTQILVLPEWIKELNNLTSLVICNLQLSNLPEWIKELDSLTSLDISENQLTTLPKWINKLHNLTSLDVSGNQLKKLPIGLQKLTQLSSLNLARNKLSILPSCIRHLSQLTSLILTANPLESLPKWINELSQLTLLNLSHTELDSLPEELNELKTLQNLNLSNNKDISLPEWIKDFSQLTTLEISGLQLGILPKWIKELIKLTKLDISSNNLDALPEWIGGFSQLISLDVEENHLASLPMELFELSQLKWINLSGNELNHIPNEISKLSQLTSLIIRSNNLDELPSKLDDLTELIWLDANQNNISMVSRKIHKLKKLIWIDLGYNQLNSLPKEIGQLDNLISLNITHNQLSNLPKEIGELSSLLILDIGYNEINHLPIEIGQLQKLRILKLDTSSEFSLTFDVEGKIDSVMISRGFSEEIQTKIKSQLKELPYEIVGLSDSCEILAENSLVETPPLEIIEQGIPAVRQYFEDIKAGTEKLYEAKLMIVGEPGAGKTTLARKLINPDSQPPKENESTRGIDVQKWHYSFDGIEYCANIWDFGGQEILNATHQFFLSRRAVYILLADSRKQDIDYIEWLHRIELFAGGSPVIIVHNEKDDRVKEINLSQITQRFPSISAPLCCNLWDLETRKNDFDTLVEKIKFEVSQLELIGKELPKTWLDVRRVIENEAAKGTNTISEENYYQLCSEHFSISRAKVLSQYLHDIGVILHFQNDPVLHHTVIIDPEWGTDAVYKVVETSAVKKNYGRFTREELLQIWSDDCYKGKYDELLQLMMNFKLCYEIPTEQGKFILPQLLPFQPKTYEWNKSENLVVQYRYSFLLKTIIVRFIVLMHRMIDDHQNNVWRNGVVLDNGNARAEIVADDKAETITIRVSGVMKKDFLSVIMHKFEEIHQEFPKMKVETMVPCNCSECSIDDNPYLFRLSDCYKAISKGSDTIQCRKSFEDVDVHPMIEDSVGRRWITKNDEILLHEVAKEEALITVRQQKSESETPPDTENPNNDEKDSTFSTETVVGFSITVLIIIGGVLFLLWGIEATNTDASTLNVILDWFLKILIIVLVVVGLMTSAQLLKILELLPKQFSSLLEKVYSPKSIIPKVFQKMTIQEKNKRKLERHTNN